jgi:drug/metabolite transporter (DMT)-like permease
MATSFSNYATNSGGEGPSWASWLGVIAILLGVFLTAVHGNELMKQAVITQSMPATGEMPAADCPEEELEEEGLSLAECEHMVANLRGIALSTPDWFPGFQMALAFAGTVIAVISIIVGAALVNYRSWAPTAAVLTFGALLVVDVIGFIAVVNTGPLLREVYLWNILLWFFIHLMMTVGAVAGRDSESMA